MLYLDQPNTGRHALMSPEMALMQGEIRTDGVDDLRRFERAFPMDPQVVVAVSKAALERHDVQGAVSPEEARNLFDPKEKTDLFFKEILPQVYNPAAAPGWTADLYFNIAGAGDYTISVAPGGVTVVEGKAGEPTSETIMPLPVFQAIMRWEILEDANQLDEALIVSDEDMSEELSDDQLEMVAGGKGDGCAIAGCNADACGADKAGKAHACGADACAANQCSTDMCGADACGADVCAMKFRGAGSCAAQVCGMDGAPGFDWGVCAINIVPVVPFI